MNARVWQETYVDTYKSERNYIVASYQQGLYVKYQGNIFIQ